MNRPSIRALALAAVGFLAVAGLGWVMATQGPMAPVQVTVAQAQEQALPRGLFGIGTVEARRSYSLGPTAAGRVARVLVDQGDSVAAGQLLAEMDPVDLDARLSAGRAAAERARALALAAESILVEAKSRARLAQASAERYGELRQKNFVSHEAADAKRHEANAAEAARAAAAASLDAARGEAQRAESDRAGAARTRANLRLESPVAGIVAARLAEPGSTLVAGQTLLQVVDPASLWVRARIDQGRAAGLAPGLAAEVVLRSRPGQVFKGRVERVDLLADAVAEERIANIVLSEPPAGLAIGELTEVSVRLPEIPRALTIPAAAVKRVGTVEGAWLVDGGRASFRPLTVGARSLDGRAEIVAGLKAGETVAVHSNRALAGEMRLQVVPSLLRTTP